MPVPERFRPVVERARPLAERFAAGDRRLYLVGGAVRDLLLGRDILAGDPDDWDLDFTTDASPTEIKRLVEGWATAVWTQGERFGTIGAQREHDGEKTRVEITTHRAEAYTPDSRKPEVQFSDSIEADLSRRDFTVNAMALELTAEEPTLVDPYGGTADLAAGVLRTPLDPHES
ncbi:CCA tRNA nucleotidyltransferase, partial [cyanobacterium TDX16]